MSYGLLGFKALVYRQGASYSFMRSQRWEHGSLTARCFKVRVDWPYTFFSCDVPERNCSCGIYAVAPLPDVAIRYMTTRNVVLTIVRAHNKTVRHQRGWRAGQAEIVAFVVPEPLFFSGVYYPHSLSLSPTREAARRLGVPMMDMVAARALVDSSWDHYTRSPRC
jgi:hypothetical protein